VSGTPKGTIAPIEEDPKNAAFNAEVPEFAPVETKPIGYFEERAKGLTAGTGPAVPPVPKYQPSMVPEGHFHAMANPTKEVDNGTIPELMLPVGLTLKNYTQQQVDAAHEAERKKKAAMEAAKYAVTKDMAQEACMMMKNMVLVAREIHDVEKGTDRQGIYDLVKVTCPSLKKKFGHSAKAMECLNCDNLLRNIKRYYDPKFVTTVKPDRCDESSWTKQNIVIGAALTDTVSFFGNAGTVCDTLESESESESESEATAAPAESNSNSGGPAEPAALAKLADAAGK
jgi:hypothetical protein